MAYAVLISRFFQFPLDALLGPMHKPRQILKQHYVVVEQMFRIRHISDILEMKVRKFWHTSSTRPVPLQGRVQVLFYKRHKPIIESVVSGWYLPVLLNQGSDNKI
ncbi:hypothetical protein FRC03_007258 [Tulasnella sp. 419]|nr:hypothetical protein FRC03_007258 [Tulasnella sp. 419]